MGQSEHTDGQTDRRTDGQTDGHFDLQKASAQGADALKIITLVDYTKSFPSNASQVHIGLVRFLHTIFCFYTCLELRYILLVLFNNIQEWTT